MTPFRTEMVGLTDRDQVMLRALLAALPETTGMTWQPQDAKARTVHFVDVDSPVGHRYWRGLDELQRRDDSIALAYTLPVQIDAQSRWLTKPVRTRALQDALHQLLVQAREPVAPTLTETVVPSLLQRIASQHRMAR